VLPEGGAAAVCDQPGGAREHEDGRKVMTYVRANEILEDFDEALIVSLYSQPKKKRMSIEEYAYQQQRRDEERLERFWRRWCASED
jgi:hypothetical protein